MSSEWSALQTTENGQVNFKVTSTVHSLELWLAHGGDCEQAADPLCTGWPSHCNCPVWLYVSLSVVVTYRRNGSVWWVLQGVVAWKDKDQLFVVHKSCPCMATQTGSVAECSVNRKHCIITVSVTSQFVQLLHRLQQRWCLRISRTH